VCLCSSNVGSAEAGCTIPLTGEVEVEDEELCFGEGGVLVVVWMEAGERGGEVDAGRLFDKMITLLEVLVLGVDKIAETLEAVK
jgi:hypothetical protein